MVYSRLRLQHIEASVGAAERHIEELSDPQGAFDLAVEYAELMDKLAVRAGEFLGRQTGRLHQETSLTLRQIADQLAVTPARVWQMKEDWRREH